VQHRTVAHRDAASDREREARVDVADHGVLQVRVGAEHDRLGLGAEHGVVPDARARLESHVPDDHGAGGHEGVVVDDRGRDAGDGEDAG